MKKSFDISFDTSELEVSAVDVSRYVGSNRYRMNARVRRHIEKGIETARGLVAPAAAFGLHAVNNVSREDKVCLEEVLGQETPCFAGNPDVKYLAAVVATLGIGLEQTCRDLCGRGEIYNATLLDAVGTCQLEALAAVCRKRLGEEARQRGVFNGVRFAPGLNGCDLNRQANLFRLVNTDRIGVDLNSDCIMKPVKSISMFTLFTSRPTDENEYHKCRHCDLKHCQFRIGDGRG